MWQVYLKELTELVRDKKTMFFVILLPILVFPVLFGIMGAVMANVVKKAESEEHRYVIVNAAQAPELADALFYHKNFKQVESDLTDVDGLKQAIRDNKFDLAIIIPADFDASAGQLNQSTWTVVYNMSSQLDMIDKYFNDVLKDYSKKLQLAKMDKLGVAKEQVDALLQPVKLDKVNTAESRENLGEKIGGFIAYILIPLCLIGCSYPAIDIGASISRVMPHIVPEAQLKQAYKLKKLYSRYLQVQELIPLGAYQQGKDQELDQAVQLYPALELFLTQGLNQASSFTEAQHQLQQLLGS